MLVAAAAVSASREQHPVAGMDEIGNHRRIVGLEDLGSDRHAQDDIAALGAGTALAHAVAALLGLEMLLIAIVDKGVQPVDGLGPNVPALATIAAIGPAEFD